MCTVTFIPRRTGYHLAMNRDEKLTRVAALPPKKHRVGDRVVIFPSEPGGGSWIALNDSGACLALINWYSAARRVSTVAFSRGRVVKAVSSASSPGSVESALTREPLARMSPFRLVGLFPATHEIVEWRWDLKALRRRNHRWKAQQWISSGFDEPAAQRIRSRTFRRAMRQRTAGKLDWLRRLHRSHAPDAGPFSTCMHRADAATVSYTEVSVFSKRARMHYQPGIACQTSARAGRQVLLRLSKPVGGRASQDGCSQEGKPGHADQFLGASSGTHQIQTGVPCDSSPVKRI
ncbi:MAG: NRDE family protein [Verrucomicrobia bacterium]|nr:NRDE family protein [Verrucomicrobiota bacterium]